MLNQLNNIHKFKRLLSCANSELNSDLWLIKNASYIF